jgi:hypothetical protein
VVKFTSDGYWRYRFDGGNSDTVEMTKKRDSKKGLTIADCSKERGVKQEWFMATHARCNIAVAKRPDCTNSAAQKEGETLGMKRGIPAPKSL